MIYLITGDNSFEADQKVSELCREYAEVERYDGAALSVEDVAGILAGTTLFAEKRCVIVKGLAGNKAVWSQLGELSLADHDDLRLILVEPRADKRTKTYKTLVKRATVIATTVWTDRHLRDAEAWTDRLARRLGIRLAPGQVSDVCRRSLVADASGKPYVDQYVIVNALKSLKGSAAVTDSQIAAVMPENLHANVFGLLATALDGDHDGLSAMLAKLRQTEEPYKLIGLIAHQWGLFIALKHGDKPPATIAADLGVHPYSLSGLARYRDRIGISQANEMTRLLADLDTRLKTTALDPWLAIERFLFGLVALKK